ncbi:MAG: lipid A 3-O-deacylase [Arenicella sp.]|jgi:lipid A 3-O-deacylase
MKTKFSKPILFVFAILLVLITRPAVADGPKDQDTWQVQWSNDVLFSSDNQFTNGITFRRHSRVFSSLEDTGGTLAFGKLLARIFLPLTAENYRESWAVGQNFQTPNDIERSDLILDAVPYVGVLGLANTFSAFDNQTYTSFQWMIGVAGPAALAEEVQTLVHNKLVSAPEPRGWDNQLDNEPLLNFYYARKYKALNTQYFDLALTADGALGNFFSHIQGAVELRLGRIPYGFLDIPTPLGRSIEHQGALRDRNKSYFYGSFAVRGTRMFLALPRDGNTFRRGNEWTEKNVVEKEDLASQVVLGLHFERTSWGAHFNVWFSSDTVRSQSSNRIADPRNNFTTLTFERRFD